MVECHRIVKSGIHLKNFKTQGLFGNGTKLLLPLFIHLKLSR